MAILVLRPRWVLFTMFLVAATAVEESAASLLVLDYNAAKLFGSVHVAGGAIDITNGAMIVTTSSFGFVPSGAPGYGHEYGSPGVAEFGDAAIHDAILEGLNATGAGGPGGLWYGSNGIISSIAASNSNSNTGIGWIDLGAVGVTGDFSYRGVNFSNAQNESIIGYSYIGDTDLSGNVDIADYEQVVNHYNRSNSGGYLPSGYVDWFDGNTYYSGGIDIGDYEDTVNNYGKPALYAGYGSGATVAGDSSTGLSDLTVGASAAFSAAQTQYVPEPSAFGLVAITAACGFGFRSLRKHRS